MKHLSFMIIQCNFWQMATAPLSSPIAAAGILKRMRKDIDAPTPEFKRAYWRPVSRKAPA